MKRNFKLFFILVALLTLTYFVEERGSRQKIAEKENQESLFNEEKLGELLSISFPSYSLVVENGHYLVDGEHPVDATKRNMVLDQLSRLRLKTVIPNREIEKVGRSFFINEKKSWVKFKFKNGFAEIYLGKKIDFSKDFYMEVVDSLSSESKIVIVEDSKPEEAIINSAGNEKSDFKYRRLQSLIWLPKDFMMDQGLFSKGKFLSGTIEKFTIDNKKKLSFMVLPSEMKLVPTIPGPFLFNESKLTSFIDQIKNMKGERVLVNVSESDFSSLLCSIIFYSNNDKMEIDFYRMHKKTLGSYAKIKNADYAIVLSGVEEQVFYTEYQDFIKKKFVEELSVGSRIDIKRDKKSLSVDLKGLNPREFQAPKKKVSQTAFAKLVDYLTKEADYFTPYLKEDGTMDGLNVRYGKENYLFHKSKDELIVLNKEKKLKLHYKVVDEAMPSLKINDYLR